MLNVLAYAQTADSGAGNLAKILGGLVILALAGLLAAILIGVARARGHRQANGIMVAALFWAVISAGSAMYSAAARFDWSKEYNTRIESGYYDPRDTSDKPRLPWLLWSTLGLAYAGILGWSFSQKSAGFGSGKPDAGGADE